MTVTNKPGGFASNPFVGPLTALGLVPVGAFRWLRSSGGWSSTGTDRPEHRCRRKSLTFRDMPSRDEIAGVGVIHLEPIGREHCG